MYVAAMRDPGTDAGTNVATQSVRIESAGLPQDDAFSEVAEDGCPAG